jgi:hypothetical protein
MTPPTDSWYKSAMNAATKDILRKVYSRPEEDQDELAAHAREIEARRTGVYVLSDEGAASHRRVPAQRFRLR